MVKRDDKLILSLMSGTSVDSVDAALCQVGIGDDGRIRTELLGFYEHPFPERLRERILSLLHDGPGSLRLTCSLNFEIGELFADAAETLLKRMELAPARLAAIASHGQTVYHIPPGSHAAGDLVPSTLQLGEPACIALRLGVPTIANFRAADMVAGGQGAPLVPFADYHLFSRADASIVIHNIGGIGNSTILRRGGTLDDVIAFDTGPGNVLIDLLVERFYPGKAYDENGAIAASGAVLEDLLGEWLEIPFITQPPPKSTGRELFGPDLIDACVRKYPHASPADLVATATRFTAASFAVNLERFVWPHVKVDHVYLAGGGALNPTLRRFIQEELTMRFDEAAPRLGVVDELGIPSKARECVAFAILGFARLLRIPANVPSATGAARHVLLGVIYEP